MVEGVAIRDIERELGRLREESTAPGQAPNLRTSVMTHLAWVPESWAGAATETLAGLEERHPSRAILLFPRPDEPESRLDAEVDLRCFLRGGEKGQVCSEVVALRLCGRRASAPGSVVTPLLVSDLPVFLRWRGPLPHGAAELEQLVEIADRLIVDSGEWPDPDADLPRLAALFEKVAVSDIAWSRTQPWRLALAALWPAVADAARLGVAGPRPEALLLAHWLGARLGREVELGHEPAGEIEHVAVDGRRVEPGRWARASASDLLSDQLDVFGRDGIYEEAIRSFSPVAT